MKKKNKSMKKNSRSGRNVFGDKAIIKVIELEKETAITQYIEMLDDIERHSQMNITLEYEVRIDAKRYSKAEIEEINSNLRKLMMFRYGMYNRNFVELSNLPMIG